MKKYKLISVLIFALLISSVNANDFYSINTDTQQKSAQQAMLMSAVIPGAGQLYVGKNTRAGVFMTIDIFSILSLIRFEKEKNNLDSSSKWFAYSKAGLNRNANDDVYRIAHTYRSSDEYNRFIEMQARNWYILVHNNQEAFDQYMSVNYIHDTWEWLTEEDFQNYRQIRNDKQNYEIYANFAIAALIINRAVSVIDAAIQTNRINKSGQLYAVPDFESRGISLVYEFKF